MDEVVCANYRPVDNNINAAVDNLHVDGEDGFGIVATSLINVKSNITQLYTCVDCVSQTPHSTRILPHSTRILPRILAFQFIASPFLLTNST